MRPHKSAMEFRKPKLRSHLDVKAVPPDMLLITSDSITILKSPLFVLLAPWLTGEHTPEEIASRLEAQASIIDVRFGLNELAKRGVLTEGDEAIPAPLLHIVDALGLDPAVARGRLQRALLAVEGADQDFAAALIKVLSGLGVMISPTGNLRVVVVGDYLGGEPEAANRRALSAGAAWMPIKPSAPIAWLGPVFGRGAACWTCLRRRLRETHCLAHEPEEKQWVATNTGPAMPPMRDAIAFLAANQITQWILLDGANVLNDSLITLDVVACQLHKHHSPRLAGCAHCAASQAPQVRAPAPPRLASAIKVFTSDGGHRACTPEEIVRKHQHHISPLAGIIRHIRPRGGGENDTLHVYEAEYCLPLRADARPVLARRAQGSSVGKGMSAVQGRASALCEALERYSGFYRGDESSVRASYADLRPSAIHPNCCMNFSSRQYRERNDWNARFPEYLWIPETFDETHELDWTPVWSLTENKSRYVPTAYCYYGYPVNRHADFCIADSNGNAAGGTLEEAAVQGFLELVERDAVALWWYNRARRPGVDLASFDQPYFTDLPSYYRRLGYRVHVLDITTDFMVPAFAAICRGKGSGVEPILGFGAHVDPVIAISRAFTEMNQCFSAARAGKPMQMLRGTVPDWCFLMPDAGAPTRRRADFLYMPTRDLKEDLFSLVQRAQSLGLQSYLLEQTRPEVGINVVKVIVPGMRQFSPRFAPGRLYEVPVSLGWRARALREEELNPAVIVA